MCRRTAAGKVQILGRVYTQKMSYAGELSSHIPFSVRDVGLLKG